VDGEAFEVGGGLDPVAVTDVGDETIDQRLIQARGRGEGVIAAPGAFRARGGSGGGGRRGGAGGVGGHRDWSGSTGGGGAQVGGAGEAWCSSIR
jgi:hypothetical protein